MKSWKTTLVGAALAAMLVLNEFIINGTPLDDYRAWIVPVLVATLGYLAKDFNATGR